MILTMYYRVSGIFGAFAFECGLNWYFLLTVVSITNQSDIDTYNNIV